MFINPINIFEIIFIFFLAAASFLYPSAQKIWHFNDPCYQEIVAGKGYFYEIQEDRVCIEYDRSGHTGYVKTLADADPTTFKQLNNYYFSDKNKAYYKSSVIKDANPATFQFIGSDYYKDEDTIFYNGEAIGADYQTFELITERRYFARDKNFVYSVGEKIDYLDTATFKIFPDSSYAKDANAVYYITYYTPAVIPDADPKTFEVIHDGTYAKDAHRVYHRDEILKDADPNTYTVPCRDWNCR